MEQPKEATVLTDSTLTNHLTTHGHGQGTGGVGMYVGWVVELDTGRDSTRDNEEQINRIFIFDMISFSIYYVYN